MHCTALSMYPKYAAQRQMLGNSLLLAEGIIALVFNLATWLAAVLNMYASLLPSALQFD
jgi:hypothetical protein